MSDERLPPPPIEPLSDLSWARLERQLWQALDAPVPTPAPRSTRWRWPVAAGALVAAAAAAAMLWPSAPRDEGGLSVPRTPPIASRVATATAETTLSFGDAGIRLAPHSALLMRGDERGVDLVLDRGQASFEVAPRPHRAPFVVHAGPVQVTVVGTGFTVTRLGDGAVVDVRHGVVEVVADGQRALVHAGETWADGSVHPTIEVTALAPGPTTVASGPSTGDATAPAPTGPAPAPTGPAPAPTSPAPAPTSPAPAPTGPAPALTGRDGATASTSTPRAPRSTPHATPPAPAFDPKAEFIAAAELESSAPTDAVARYLALAEHGGAWGANALYAAARLRFELGDKAEARALSERYLRTYPRGRNAADARTLLERDAR